MISLESELLYVRFTRGWATFALHELYDFPLSLNHFITDFKKGAHCFRNNNSMNSIEFTLFYETVAMIYLTSCLLFVPISPPLIASCNMNSKHNTSTFLFWVLWPVVSVRAIGYCMYRNTTFNKLRNLTLLINA